MPDYDSLQTISEDLQQIIVKDIEVLYDAVLTIRSKDTYKYNNSSSGTTNTIDVAISYHVYDPDAGTDAAYQVPTGKEAVVVFSWARNGGGQFASSTALLKASTTVDTDNGRSPDGRSTITANTGDAKFGPYVFKAGEFVTLVCKNANGMKLSTIHLVERPSTS